MLQQWADFLKLILPFLQNRFVIMFLPIINRICTELSKYDESAFGQLEKNMLDRIAINLYIDMLECIILHFMQDETKVDAAALGKETNDISILELVLNIKNASTVFLN